MSLLMDLTGTQFGRLTAVALHTKVPRPKWRCRCACGGETISSADSLRRGGATSCGCSREEQRRNRARTHGASSTPEYGVWASLLYRARTKGLTVTPRWSRFENFLADVGPRPTPLHHLFRVRDDVAYSKRNTRWALRAAHQRTAPSNQRLTFQGRTLTLAQWATDLGLDYNTIYMRVNRLGWSVERALTTRTGPHRRTPGLCTCSRTTRT